NELIQSQLKQVGIQMKIESGELNSVVIKRAIAGDFEAVGVNWTNFNDPDFTIYGAFHTGAPLNVSHLSDPEIDRLASEGRREPDQSKRAAIYKQANTLIMAHSPWVMISYGVDRFTGNKKVQGWHRGWSATLRSFAEVWKTAD